MKFPDLKYELHLWKKGYLVIGVDEVGRGAFAGPLFVAGAVFAPTTKKNRIKELLSYGINDSKKLNPAKRKMLSKIIQKECLAYYISKISVAKINQFGIGKSTFIGIRDVVKNLREKLPIQKRFVLIDKFYVRNLAGIGLKNQKGIVHGDEISLSIAAASIIAKVARDNHMRRLSAKYPAYKWGQNKGYGTSFHRSAIKKFGPTPHHRSGFTKQILL